MNDRSKQWMAESLLVLVMFFWGATFVVVKEIIQEIPVHWFHTLRFTLGAGAVWMLVALTGRAAKVSRGAAVAGCWMGVALFLSYAFQTFGLLTTTASKSAFITGTSVLWVPFMAMAVFRTRLEGTALLSGCAGLVGLLLLVMDHGWTAFWADGVVRGDVLTLVCAVCVAAHLLLTKQYSAVHDAWVLTAAQLTVVAVLSLSCSFVWGEERSFAHSAETYGKIAFLGLVATAFNFWALTFAQRFTTAQRTAVIYLFEPVFAVGTAWAVLGEVLGMFQWVGMALILGSVFMLEVRAGKNGC